MLAGGRVKPAAQAEDGEKGGATDNGSKGAEEEKAAKGADDNKAAGAKEAAAPGK